MIVGVLLGSKGFDKTKRSHVKISINFSQTTCLPNRGGVLTVAVDFFRKGRHILYIYENFSKCNADAFPFLTEKLRLAWKLPHDILMFTHFPQQVY